MASSHTLKLLPLERAQARPFFEARGFQFAATPPEHSVFRAKGHDCTATLYASGKLLLQGRGADAVHAQWQTQMGHGGAQGSAGSAVGAPEEARRSGLDAPAVGSGPYAQALALQPTPAPSLWIGTDEAGKGDWLGPLVVAGVALDRTQLAAAYALGVDDSKKLNDAKLPEMARGLAQIVPYEILVLPPARYNALYARMGNLNKLLAWAHAQVIEALLARGVAAEWILVDRFAAGDRLRSALGPLAQAVALTERPKAEADPAVGAASVFARATYLKQLSLLGERLGLPLRAGAGPPALAAGRAVAVQHGREALGEVAKLHFASTAQALAGLGG